MYVPSSSSNPLPPLLPFLSFHQNALPPCPAILTHPKGAGVPYGTGNVTDWPLDGGSLELDLHHDWTYVFINLGIEADGNVTTHNITLTPQFWNATGSGVLCVEKLNLTTPAKEGQKGSIQVVTVGDAGAGLYNVSYPLFSAFPLDFGGLELEKWEGGA